MKGYDQKKRALFVRITAIILAVLLIAGTFSMLFYR